MITASTPFEPSEMKPNGNRTANYEELRLKYYNVLKSQNEIRRITAIVKQDPYEQLAASLQDLLLRNWNRQTHLAITNVIRVLKGQEQFIEGDLSSMISKLKVLLGPALADNVATAMDKIQMESYGNGLQGAIESSPTFHLIDNQAIQWLRDHNVYWVRNHFDRQLQDQVQQLGEQAIREGWTRYEAGKAFEKAFYQKYDPESYRYWEGFANHVVTRSREFGRVSGYERARIKYLQVRAILDNRTSVICRHMNGRIIATEDAVILRNKMLNAETPQDVIKIAPFMNASDAAELTTATMRSKKFAFALPPYHFDCRSRTVKYRGPDPLNNVNKQLLGKSVTDEQKKPLKAFTNAEYTNKLSEIRRKKQIAFKRDELLRDWSTVASRFGFKSIQEYRLAANRAIKGSDRILVGFHDKEQLFYFWNSQTETYTVVNGAQQIVGHYDARNISFDQQRANKLWLKISKPD